jgi:hypothetical protein
MVKLLRIEAPHFVAGALWKKHNEEWQCFKAAPILQWMVGKPVDEVKRYIDRKAWEYEWL